MRGFLCLSYAIVIPLVACSSASSPVPPSPPCGGVCGGTGPVSLQVVNPTATDTIRAAWWWRGVVGDSAKILPNDSQCVHFTAVTWAQVEGFYGASQPPGVGGSYGSDAFDPLALPNWKLVARPESLPKNLIGAGNWGFVVTNPSNPC